MGIEPPLFLQFKHKSCSMRVAAVNVTFNEGAVMDMMWLFATVMGVLLLGGIIVYKKSA